MGLEVVHHDAIGVIGWIKNLVLVDFEESPEVVHVRALGRAFEQAHGRYPGGVGTMIVVRGGVPRFTEEFRRAATEVTRATEHGGLATAVVVLQRGLIAAGVRAFLGGIFLAARSKEPMKVFASTAEAASWLVQHISADVAWTAAELEEVATSSRAGLPV